MYVEGSFLLADSKTPVIIKDVGTDFLRIEPESILMPNFVKSQSENLTASLEKDLIYDAGEKRKKISIYRFCLVLLCKFCVTFDIDDVTKKLEFLVITDFILYFHVDSVTFDIDDVTNYKISVYY